MKRVFLILGQVLVLLVVNAVGHVVAELLPLPLPGNLLGMVLLFALLASGLMRLEWIELGASLLIRHLAFFFVPITVGLMGFSQLFLEHGLAIFAILIASAAVGIFLTGLCSQLLSHTKHGAAPP